MTSRAGPVRPPAVRVSAPISCSYEAVGRQRFLRHCRPPGALQAARSSQPTSRSGAMPIRAGIPARSRKLHVVQATTLPTRNQVLLGDYLPGHPNDVARYGALKRRLAALHDNGGDYTRAKTELIQELTDKARAPADGSVRGVSGEGK